MRDLDRAPEMKSDYGDAHFNQACIYSLINRPDDALESLQTAIFLDPEHLANATTDPDFYSIRDDPGFRELVSE